MISDSLLATWLAALGLVVLMLLTLFARVLWRRRRQQHGLDLLHKAPTIEPEAFVRVAELKHRCVQRTNAIAQRQEEVDKRVQVLKKREYESLDVDAVLKAATQQERSNLAAILKLPHDTPSRQLASQVRRDGSHVIGILFRRGDAIAYSEVVRDVGNKLKVPRSASATVIYDQERPLLQAAFVNTLDQASPEQRAAILADLTKSNRGASLGLGASAATLAATNLSGFALYTAASTSLAAVTGAIGVTLPFATYMGMSSILATVTGPAGWAALGAWALIQYGGANFKKTVPAVLLIGTIRTRLIAERDQELQSLEAERSSLAQDLRKLNAFLESVASLSDDHRVRLADVPP